MKHTTEMFKAKGFQCLRPTKITVRYSIDDNGTASVSFSDEKMAMLQVLVDDNFKKMAIKVLKQEPKIGHWEVVSDGYGDNAYICECSECKDTVWVYKDADRKWNYCPNCGAKMAESEDKE